MRSRKAGAALIAAALGTIACGASAPPGPVVHEHHIVERGTATRANVEIVMSAGELAVKSGATTLLEGDVTVTAGAGDTTIHLPASVGISARTSGLIGDVNVNGLEKRDGRWVNTRAETSPVTVDLQVQHAIGDLRILAE